MAKKKGSKKRALQKAREEEEARRLAEELERQRVQREQHEREEQERLKHEEAERRGREIDEYHALLGRFAHEVRETKRTTTHNEVWQQFLDTGQQQPDPTNLHDMNFLVTRWRDRRDYGDRQALFQTMDMTFWALNVMQERLWGTIEYRWSEQTMADLLEVFDEMCATIMLKFDIATYHALENYNKLVDPRTEIASTEYKGKRQDFAYALWSPAGQQLMVPPDQEGFYSLSATNATNSTEDDAFRFEFPKSLGTSVALRYLRLPFEVFCQEGTNHLFRALWQIQNACFDCDRIALDDKSESSAARKSPTTTTTTTTTTAAGEGAATDLSINVTASDTTTTVAASAAGGAQNKHPTGQQNNSSRSPVAIAAKNSTATQNKSPISITPSASKTEAAQSTTSLQRNSSSTGAGNTGSMVPVQPPPPPPPPEIKSNLKDELEAFVQQEEQNIAKFTAAFGPLTRMKSATNLAQETNKAKQDAAVAAAAAGSPATSASKAVILNASASTATKPTTTSPPPPPSNTKSNANSPSTDASKLAAAEKSKTPLAPPPATAEKRSSKRSSSAVKSGKGSKKGKAKGKGKKVRESSVAGKKAIGDNSRTSKNNSPSSGGGRRSQTPNAADDAKSETASEGGSDTASEASTSLAKRIRVASDVELVAPDISGGVHSSSNVSGAVPPPAVVNNLLPSKQVSSHVAAAAAAAAADIAAKRRSSEASKSAATGDGTSPGGEGRISITPTEDEFINLQNNIAVGGVHAIELFELPPLPARVKGVEITLIDSSPQLQKTNFAMPQIPAELEQLDDEKPENVEAKRKFYLDNSIGLRIAVPENRQRLYGNSVIAMWNEKHRHWSAAGLMQAVYHRGVIDLRVCNIAPICLFQSKWIALPFKSWKLIPKRLHSTWLYLETAAPESIVIEIGETGQCRLHSPRNLDISLQWLQANQLVHALIARGMYIFPALDDDATLDGVAKAKQLPARKILSSGGEIKAYIAMAMMCGLYEFAHSMWNTSTEFQRDECVMQYRPAEWWSEFRVQPPSEEQEEEVAAEATTMGADGAAAENAAKQQQTGGMAQAPAATTPVDPAKLYQQPQRLYFRGNERRLCLVSSARSMTLNMKEHDVQFSRLPSSPFHPDAYHLLVEQAGTSNHPELLQQLARAPLFFSAVYSLLVLTRVLSFTYNH